MGHWITVLVSGLLIGCGEYKASFTTDTSSGTIDSTSTTSPVLVLDGIWKTKCLDIGDGFFSTRSLNFGTGDVTQINKLYYTNSCVFSQAELIRKMGFKISSNDSIELTQRTSSISFSDENLVIDANRDGACGSFNWIASVKKDCTGKSIFDNPEKKANEIFTRNFKIIGDNLYFSNEESEELDYDFPYEKLK